MLKSIKTKKNEIKCVMGEIIVLVENPKETIKISTRINK